MNTNRSPLSIALAAARAVPKPMMCGAYRYVGPTRNDKPRIKQMSSGFWTCKQRDTFIGVGRDAEDAYTHWTEQNRGRD